MCGHSESKSSPEWVEDKPTERGYYAYAQFFSCGCLVFGGFIDVYMGYLEDEYQLIYSEKAKDQQEGVCRPVHQLPDHTWFCKIDVPKSVYDP